jgi:hypothetical protein
MSQDGSLRQLVEAFENERYIPVAGWSKKLLGTDKAWAFGNRDASHGVKTLEEYEKLLLSAGWEFDESRWAPATQDINTDDQGWSYCLNFPEFHHSKSTDEGEGDPDERSSVVHFSDVHMLDGGGGGHGPLSLVELELMNKAALAMQTPPTTPYKKASGERDASIDRDSSFVVAASPDHVYRSRGYDKGGFTTPTRRRRLTRWMQFRPLLLLSDEYATAKGIGSHTVPPPKLSCEHCDYQELDKLAVALLKALTKASLVAHPRQLDEFKVLRLKSSMLLSLDLKKQHSDMMTASSGTASAAAAADSDSYSYQSVLSKLDAYIETCRSNWASLSEATMGGKLTEEQKKTKRETILATYFFSYSERRSIAEMIIRGSDRKHAFHCDILLEVKCGDQCKFAPRRCPHEGCGLTLSHLHLADHDGKCIYKPVPCIRGCTCKVTKPPVKPTKPPKKKGGKGKEKEKAAAESDDKGEEEDGVSTAGKEGGEEEEWREEPVLVARRDMDSHLSHACPLRPVECPFHSLGCMAPGLRATDVVGHVEECSVSHSLLLVARVVEQTEVIKTLSKRNHALEETVAKLESANESNDNKVNAVIASVTAGFAAVQKKNEAKEKTFFEGLDKRVGAKLAETGKGLEEAQKAERERVNGELRKVAEALAAQKAYNMGEFEKIQHAAQEQRTRGGASAKAEYKK